MPEISVIVPVYNAESYLHRCVDSILAQTFTDFELILVDDGSPDKCPAICDEYAARDNRVQVIHKANGGVSAARNTGLDAACGKYIMFCDSDDYVDSDWCQELYNAVQGYPTSCIVSNFMRVWPDKMAAKISPELNIGHNLSYYEMYLMGLSGATWNKIYNHTILNEHSIRFHPEIRIGEDVGFNAQYHQHCDTITYISKPLYYYRDTPESALNSYHPDWLGLHLYPFYVRIPLIEKDKIPEYCDGWLCMFINFFKIVFDRRNNASFSSKLHYNHRMLNTKEFRYCLDHATGKAENPIVMKLLRTHNYYLYWLFQKIVQIKNGIMSNGRHKEA